MSRLGAALAVCAAFAVLGCGAAGAGEGAVAERPRGEAVSLAVRLEEGAVYEGALSMVQVLASGHRIETDMAVRTRVLGVVREGFQLEDSFADLRVRMNGKAFDPAPEMEGVEQVRIRYLMDARGRTVGEAEARGVTEANAAFAEQLVASAGSDAVPFPAEPVHPGEGWATDRDIAMETGAGVLEGRVHERHELARVEEVDGDRWAVLLITGNIQIDPLETDQVRLGGEGTVSGERRVLLQDGFTSRAHSDLAVTFHGKGGPQGRKIRMKERSSTSLRIARVEDPSPPEPTPVPGGAP
jgi:hypothetical protein